VKVLPGPLTFRRLHARSGKQNVAHECTRDWNSDAFSYNI